MAARRLTLWPRLARAGSAALFAASAIIRVTPNGEQYDDDTPVTVEGYGFRADSMVTIGALTLTPSTWTPTTLTVTVPDALAANSPLKTSGAKTVAVSTGGATTWTVTSWSFGVNPSAAAIIANQKRAYVVAPADVGGVAYGAKFSPLTDRAGVANLIQATAGNRFQYVANAVGTHDGVYTNSGAFADWAGDPFSAGPYFWMLVMQLGVVDASDANQRRYMYSGNVNVVRLASTPKLRFIHSDSSLSTALDTGTLVDGQQIVLTGARDPSNLVSGLSLTVSDGGGIGSLGTATGAPRSSNPAAGSIRIGALAAAAEGSGGARIAQALVCSGTATPARRQRQAIREDLLTTGLSS